MLTNSWQFYVSGMVIIIYYRSVLPPEWSGDIQNISIDLDMLAKIDSIECFHLQICSKKLKINESV